MRGPGEIHPRVAAERIYRQIARAMAAVRTDYDPFEARMTPYDPNGAAIRRGGCNRR